MATEFEQFMTLQSSKSEATKKSYAGQYKKLVLLLRHNVTDVSERKTIEAIETFASNPNQQSSLINIAILVRRMEKMPTELLVKKRDKNKADIEQRVKQVNSSLNLPSLTDLHDYLDYLYEHGKYSDFIINYLMLELHVRNKDLVFKIVTRKKDMVDKTKNYIWLDVRHKKALYVRNDYKTSKTYGEKRNQITDTRFITALKRVLACQKHQEECGVIIKNQEHVGYYVQKSSYKNMGEGAYLKVIIDAHRKQGDMQKLTEIAANRGTDVTTLLNSYETSKV